MARKSRKHLFGREPADKILKNEPKIYKMGAYVRLSVINNENKESIENQIEIIKEFISQNYDLRLVEIYEEIGKTGLDFDRSEFKRLMDDVKTGKIDCIVVKDLSRFGRNFVETGNYIERVFPYLNIRFIAIIDNFDTNCADNDIIAVAFKNLINEFYSRDISEKIKSSLLTKQLEGKYLSGLAPYGYKRDQKDKYSLVIDEETAPTVRRIFEMKYKGKSYSEISKQLNSENIVPPFAYAKGEVYNTDKKNKFWSDCVVRSILKNRVYIGCNVSKKTKRLSLSSKIRIKSNENEIIISENTHQPIIDKNIFDNVQKIISEEKKHTKNRGEAINAEDIFKNVIYCGICGSKMKLRSRRRNKSVYSVYYCYNHSLYGDIACKNKCNINYNHLKTAVYHSINTVIKISISDDFFDNYEFKIPKSISEKEAAIIEMKNKISEVKNNKLLLFERYAGNFISQQEYLCENEKISLIEDRLMKNHDFLNNLSERLMQISKDKSFNFLEEDLNRKAVEFFINRINIYNNNRIEIVCNFSDCFKKYIE